MPLATKAVQEHSRSGSPLEVLLAFGKLGVTCFGGPIAHIGYFREEFVVQRRWLDEHAYADLVALCQFLPGPASSQVGFSIGLMRGGYLGGLAAWTAFTLPSAILLVLFAYGAATLQGLSVIRTNCATCRTPNFFITRPRCSLIVFSRIPRMNAVSLFILPATRWFRTSFSRRVRFWSNARMARLSALALSRSLARLIASNSSDDAPVFAGSPIPASIARAQRSPV